MKFHCHARGTNPPVTATVTANHCHGYCHGGTAISGQKSGYCHATATLLPRLAPYCHSCSGYRGGSNGSKGLSSPADAVINPPEINRNGRAGVQLSGRGPSMRNCGVAA